MKAILITLISFAISIGNPLTVIAQSQTLTCFQKNYGEDAGWEKANFKIKIDMGNHKISIYDPKLQEFIGFSPTEMYGHEDISSLDEKTTLIKGTDQRRCSS